MDCLGRQARHLVVGMERDMVYPTTWSIPRELGPRGQLMTKGNCRLVRGKTNPILRRLHVCLDGCRWDVAAGRLGREWTGDDRGNGVLQPSSLLAILPRCLRVYLRITRYFWQNIAYGVWRRAVWVFPLRARCRKRRRKSQACARAVFFRPSRKNSTTSEQIC